MVDTTILEDQCGWKNLRALPNFLKNYRWRPKYVFQDKISKNLIGVDLVYNEQIAERIYREEARKVVNENAHFFVCLLTPSDNPYEQLKDFCKKYKFGLKVFSPNKIHTIRPFEFEKKRAIFQRKRVRVKGWFPEIILNELVQLKKIDFRNSIIDLAKKLRTTKQDKQLSVVCHIVDKILANNPFFKADLKQFIGLAKFESLYKDLRGDADYNDHVLHSTRVFLIGCIIIDKYYKQFTTFHHDILGADVKVEYIWLLAAISHDIGRIKQKMFSFYLHDNNTENPAIKEGIRIEQNKYWQEDEYKIALGNLVELIERCQNKSLHNVPFVGYALGGELNTKIAGVLVDSFNNMTSHGVLSCFEVSTDILKKMKAAGVTAKNSKTFILYYCFPAALSMALHDHKIWKELANVNVFPIKFNFFSIPALLIYIDTWDDYKRGSKEKISIDSINFQKNCVTINVTWFKQEDYIKEKIKYESYERNVLFDDIKLIINVSNERR
jgi:hypothetical protein